MAGTESAQYTQIEVRRIPFEFPDDLEPVWNPGHPEWSHMVNGSSVTMPYLEPFMIASLREAESQISDPEILEELRDFLAQEGQHFRAHRRYNELLKANGYEELAEVEKAMKRGYARIADRRSLAFRLAYTLGFESNTLGVTRWLINERKKLFAGSDARIASFVLWHMVEEVEHKRVAFDVYQAYGGPYWQRALGVFYASAHVLWWTRKACVVMLKKDGRWRDPRSRIRLWIRTAEFLFAVSPVALRSALPGHDPRDIVDPEWVEEWITAYESNDTGEVPYLDTSDPEVPVPFSGRLSS